MDREAVSKGFEEFLGRQVHPLLQLVSRHDLPGGKDVPERSIGVIQLPGGNIGESDHLSDRKLQPTLMRAIQVEKMTAKSAAFGGTLQFLTVGSGLLDGMGDGLFLIVHPDRDRFQISPDDGSRSPVFVFDDEDAQLWREDHEIRVAAIQIGFVIDDTILRESRQQSVESGFAFGAFRGKSGGNDGRHDGMKGGFGSIDPNLSKIMEIIKKFPIHAPGAIPGIPLLAT